MKYFSIKLFIVGELKNQQAQTFRFQPFKNKTGISFNFSSIQMETALKAIKSQLPSKKREHQATLIRTPRRYNAACNMPCQRISMIISTKRLIKKVSKILKQDSLDIKIIDSNGHPITGKIDLGSCKGLCSR